MESKTEHILYHEKQRQEKEQLKEELISSITGPYCSFTRKQAEIIFDRAWAEGYAYGYNNVRYHFEDLAEWSEELINAK